MGRFLQVQFLRGIWRWFDCWQLEPVCRQIRDEWSLRQGCLLVEHCSGSRKVPAEDVSHAVEGKCQTICRKTLYEVLGRNYSGHYGQRSGFRQIQCLVVVYIFEITRVRSAVAMPKIVSFTLDLRQRPVQAYRIYQDAKLELDAMRDKFCQKGRKCWS